MLAISIDATRSKFSVATGREHVDHRDPSLEQRGGGRRARFSL